MICEEKQTIPIFIQNKTGNITKKQKVFIFSILLFFFISCEPSKNKKIVKKIDPLPSWNNTQTKKHILSFIESTTNTQSEDFIPKNERVVTFDNDGTLMTEQPMYMQYYFMLDRAKELSILHPEWEQDPAMKDALVGRLPSLKLEGEKGVLKLLMLTHAGMNTVEFEAMVKKWVEKARHPNSGKLFKQMVYQPMIELIQLLQKNDFKVFIVSGGGIEFIRPWVEEVYGVPKENVIGSTIKVQYQFNDTTPVLIRIPEISFLDEGDNKPIGIHQHIGIKPCAAFGNADNDIPMLHWADSENRKNLLAFIHHTDEKREYAYDTNSSIGKLNKGLEEAKNKNWLIVDMKKDWKYIYAFENKNLSKTLKNKKKS